MLVALHAMLPLTSSLPASWICCMLPTYQHEEVLGSEWRNAA